MRPAVNFPNQQRSVWAKLSTLLSWTVMACVLCSGTKVLSQQIDGVEAGKDALSEVGTTPWYDPKNEAYKIPSGLTEDDAEGRKSDWLAKRNQWNWPNGPSPGTFSIWGSILSYLAPVMIYGVLPCILLIVLVWALHGIAPDYFRFNRKEKRDVSKGELDLARISDLPFNVEMNPTDPLAEAKRCMAQGDFEKAIIYLFAYQLLQLDAQRFITLQRGKTNWSYLRELRSNPEMRSIMEGTVLTFEQVFFGRYPLEREKFMYCWNRLDDFHRLLNPAKQSGTSPLSLGGLT